MKSEKAPIVKKILVPTDFSSFGEDAITLACNLPDSDEAEIHLLHILHETRLSLDGSVETRDRRIHALELLHQCLLPETEISRKIIRDIREGLPHVEICKYVREHDIELIVMGTCGRSGLSHLVLGSTAERVLRNAPCQVIVVRPKRAEVSDSSESDDSVESQQRTNQIKNGATPAVDLIQRATAVSATDIHLDPTSDGSTQVRFRIDGRLEQYCELDKDVANHLVHQLKNLAELDITDPFHPQEGNLRLPPDFQEQEVRLTTAPVAGGEAVAMRLIARGNVLRPLEELGFLDQSRSAVEQMLQSGEGLILVTGPTGSGKSTTVYSMLQAISSPNKNIVSVEDPVEFKASFLRQMAVSPEHGISMGSGLRTMLRMDPDIIFLGEIRDPEAAQNVMRAASSGKYVFSTLHTREVAGTLTALHDLQLDSRTIAGNLNGIISQRLVRRLCDSCSELSAVEDEFHKRCDEVGLEPPSKIASAVGCSKCRNTGYSGRIGIFEAYIVSDAFCEATLRGASEEELRKIIRQAGTPSLEYDGLQKVINGLTSFQEIQEMRWL